MCRVETGVMSIRAALRVFALLAAGVVAGCGTPGGMLGPVANIPESNEKVALYIATSRAPSLTDAALIFGGDRARTPNHARIVVSIPPSHVAGEVELPGRSTPDPAKHFVASERDVFGDKDFIERIRRAVAARPPQERDVLVFIHGYNTRFDDAVFRFAQIVHDSGFKGVPVLFTWPSRGSLLSYPYDRESAVYSRDDLDNLLQAIATKTGARKFDILAHSMGGFLTAEVLRGAAMRGNGRYNGKLDQAMFAAPDIDIDVFRRQLEKITPQRLPITVFVSADDKALGFSRFVWGSSNRAGAFTVTDPEMAQRLAERNVTVVDLSDVKTSDSLGHGKFAASPKVVQMIGGRLAADGGIKSRGASLGESLVVVGSSLGHTVGGVAAGVVAAPVKVLEGKDPVPATLKQPHEH
jgi:esterase/lipase superfamily enzyme